MSCDFDFERKITSQPDSVVAVLLCCRADGWLVGWWMGSFEIREK
jgi:hypothetical protein